MELYLTLNEKNAAHKEVIVQWDLLVPFEAGRRRSCSKVGYKRAVEKSLEKLIVHEAFLDIRENNKKIPS